jgi:Domain of unknown function (DUF4149)
MFLLRFLLILSLIAWIGSLIFFSFVLAPTAFAVLPSRHLAGSVVARSLGALHWIGLISGLVFLFASLLYARLNLGDARPFAARNVLIVLMLVLTCISQFGISPRMHAIRTAVGEFDNVPLDEPARLEFNALHAWSTRLEGSVFLLGLIVAYLTAQQLK